MKFILILAFILPSFIQATEKAPEDIIRWKALLHVTDNLFGEESQADGMNFFLSSNGKEDYLAEYKANLEKFQSDKNYVCNFPARSKFIARELNQTAPSISHCTDYNDFQKRLSARSISLVFSSYYLNNPSSAFGHTLLRFKKESDVTESEKYQLLDYAANFAANVTTSNALIYAVKGTFGGFHGEFAVMPYFYKIREYNDFESRDLWDYELNISSDEIDWVIAHLWEMKQTYFDYYYLSENCSYHILGLLNVANPNWKLLEKINRFVPPVDTIKAITRTEGLLKHLSFRPSKRRVLIASAANLSGDELNIFQNSLKEKNLNSLKGLAPESKAKVLDTLIEYFDFENADAIVAENKEVLNERRELLVARAETGVSSRSAIVQMPERESPHMGHETGRISLMGGHSSQYKTVGQLSYRYALHDLLDPVRGQNPNAIMEMGNFVAKYFSNYQGKDKIFLERADLIQVLSLSPFTSLIPKGSWRLRLGSERINDLSCDSCYTPTLDTAYGLSFGEGDYKLGVMLHTEFQANKELSHEGIRAGAGPEMFLLLRPREFFSLKLSGEMNWWLWSHLERTYEYGPEMAFHLTNNTSIRLKHTRVRGGHESLMGANFFF